MCPANDVCGLNLSRCRPFLNPVHPARMQNYSSFSPSTTESGVLKTSAGGPGGVYTHLGSKVGVSRAFSRLMRCSRSGCERLRTLSPCLVSRRARLYAGQEFLAQTCLQDFLYLRDELSCISQSGLSDSPLRHDRGVVGSSLALLF